MSLSRDFEAWVLSPTSSFPRYVFSLPRRDTHALGRESLGLSTPSAASTSPVRSPTGTYCVQQWLVGTESDGMLCCVVWVGGPGGPLDRRHAAGWLAGNLAACRIEQAFVPETCRRWIAQHHDF